MSATPDPKGRAARPVPLFVLSALCVVVAVYGSRLLLGATGGHRIVIALVGLVLGVLGIIAAIIATRRAFASKAAEGSLAPLGILTAALIALNASAVVMGLVTLLEELARPD